MASCCDADCGLEALRTRQRSTLVSVLWINVVLFFLVVAAALYSGSTALLSDSLDDLGDAFTYGLSLYVVSRSARAKAQVALLKGGLILLGALVVVGQVVWKFAHPVVPVFEVMGAFSLAGVAANGTCLWLLARHRSDDINMRSVYECSRNDIASNLSVFVAAFGVWLFDSGWPDVVVASLLAALLLRSSGRVIGGALAELRATP
jgi:Co/Zn/Cd efflux system component